MIYMRMMSCTPHSNLYISLKHVEELGCGKRKHFSFGATMRHDGDAGTQNVREILESRTTAFLSLYFSRERNVKWLSQFCQPGCGVGGAFLHYITCSTLSVFSSSCSPPSDTLVALFLRKFRVALPCRQNSQH